MPLKVANLNIKIMICPHLENELPDYFWYKVDGLDREYALSFYYNTGERYFHKGEFTEDITIDSIVFTDSIN